MEYLRRYKTPIAAFIVGGFVFFIVGAKWEAAKALSMPPASLTNIAEGEPSGVDFSAFWKVWNILKTDYVPTGVATSTQTNDQDKVYGAIQGLTASLGDPYTVFFPPAESKDFAS